MGEKTSIAWTDATFSPVWGCERVSPGCQYCFAAALANRWQPKAKLWDGDNFRTFGVKHWALPFKWNDRAAREHRRIKVFCGSMCDVFDKRWPAGIRERLWETIRGTPHLDWQLVTKRIGNAKWMLPPDWGTGWPNVWIIASIVNQEEANRDMDKLLYLPAQIRGVSYEPALGPVDWRRWVGETDWIIYGGESNQGGCREAKLEWAEQTVEQCRTAGVAVFVKQLGSDPTWKGAPYLMGHPSPRTDPRDWPEHLSVQEFPR